MNTEQKNKEFENALISICENNLKDGYNAEIYACMTLDELWNGETYVTCDGDLYYYEIGGHETKSGNPVLVSTY